MTLIAVDIPDTGHCCREFDVARPDGFPITGFVVRHGGLVRAFLNQCPHTGAPLNWNPDDFFSADGRWIQCSLHGALFDPDDGRCVAGPCTGERLQALPIRRKGNQWLVDLDQAGNSARSDGK